MHPGLAKIEVSARRRRKVAMATIQRILTMSNIPESAYNSAMKAIQNHAQVALHFHPDRLISKNETVAGRLLKTGQYRNQFSSGISNGKLAPNPTGIRAQWENSLFGEVYQNVPAENRPKYGALNLMMHPNGPAPRFGSCYFLLKAKTSRRCTFTYLDSHKNPPEKGSLTIFEDVFAALLSECFERNFALGQDNLSPAKLVNHLIQQVGKPPGEGDYFPPAGNLDFYIEAQVHGDISLADDVSALVVDSAFKNTETGKHLMVLCQKYRIDLKWHAGYWLPVTAVPSDFRGAKMPLLAGKIAENGVFDAAMIGLAAKDAKLYPEKWKGFGTPAEVQQSLKLLWHVLVKFGC